MYFLVCITVHLFSVDISALLARAPFLGKKSKQLFLVCSLSSLSGLYMMMFAKQVANFVQTKICQFGAVLSGFCRGSPKVWVFVRTSPQSTKKSEKNFPAMRKVSPAA